MRRKTSNVLPLTALFIVLGLVWISVSASGQGAGYVPSTQKGDWPYYTADLKGTKYSPLDQINASNFNKLEVAWRFKTDNLGPRPEYKLEGTPLAINGTLYTTGGTRRSVISLDGKTGEVNWAFSFREGKRAAIAPRQLSGRGVSYWTDGRGDDRVVFVSTGYRLVELNAHTGAQITTFGQNGMVDLKVGMVTGAGQQIDLETGEAGLHSTPLVVKDVVIVGSSFKEGMTPVTHNNTKGMVRAYDVHTGKQLWTFNTIPRPGEFGNDTWENGSWAQNGNTGVWTQMTVDEDLGLVYLPVEDPTSDYYGGHRPGNNLFGDSLVCVDLRTGKRKWHYQIVHHPIWDYDLSSAPILADINVNGSAIKAVALPTKEAFLYVFDRVTGQPVWPIEEKPVQQSDVPGEKTSPDAAVPDQAASLRAELSQGSRRPDRLHARNARAGQGHSGAAIAWPACSIRRWSAIGKGLLGAINVGNAGGGTNWPGAGYDPETHIVYAQAANSSAAGLSLRKPPPGIFRHELLLGPRRSALPRSARTRLRHRRGFPAGQDRRASADSSSGRPRRRSCCLRFERGWPSDHEAAIRRHLGDQPGSRRSAMAGSVRRNAGQCAQNPHGEGHQVRQSRPEWQRRITGDQNAGHSRRYAGHQPGNPSARRDAARV